MIIADDHFNDCETLQDLCDELNTIDTICWERHEPFPELPSLPVFSDDMPEEDCLSWDDVSVLKIDDDNHFYIDDRQDCVEDETPKKMFYSQYFYH